MALKARYAGLLRGLPSRLARAAAKKSWENRDLPNWRDRVGDLLEGKQIFVKDLREFNALYVAPDAKECKHVASSFLMRDLLSLPKVFPIARLNLYAAGNVYYTRQKELSWLLNLNSEIELKIMRHFLLAD